MTSSVAMRLKKGIENELNRSDNQMLRGSCPEPAEGLSMTCPVTLSEAKGLVFGGGERVCQFTPSHQIVRAGQSAALQIKNSRAWDSKD
jgi:hypothetical protein